jgi:hypothetical protein
MKIKALFVLCVLFFRPFAVYAWDLTLSGGVDFASYPPDSQSSVGINLAPVLLPVYLAEFKGEFAVEYNYNIRVFYDTIWREVFSGDVGYRFGKVDIGLGFFMSDFNTTVITHAAGFSGRAGFEFPGVFFINAGVASSLDDGSWPAGASKKRMFSGKAGFWLPHIFVTFDFETKSFIEKVTETLEISNGRTRYKGSIEIYSKNVPYRLRFDFGMQELSREMTDGVPLESASTSHFFAGFGFYARPGKIFAWFIDGEILLNLFNSTNLGTGINYRATAGVIFSYPEN